MEIHARTAEDVRLLEVRQALVKFFDQHVGALARQAIFHKPSIRASELASTTPVGGSALSVWARQPLTCYTPGRHAHSPLCHYSSDIQSNDQLFR